jgi:phage tail sheath gpL-like
MSHSQEIHWCECDRLKVARWTVFNIHNTLSWCCDYCAAQAQDEARDEPELWVGTRLLHYIEETDSERETRIERDNVLWDD